MTPIDSGRVAIEPARESDLPTILRFIGELAEYEKLADQVVANVENLRTCIFGPEAHVGALIARVGAEPIGFALYFFNFSSFLARPGLYLEDLYVREDYRGHGAGLGLLARLASIARDRNCGRMEWWVLDWNRSSIDFYRKLGAESMDDWTVFRLTGRALDALAAEAQDS